MPLRGSEYTHTMSIVERLNEEVYADNQDNFLCFYFKLISDVVIFEGKGTFSV